MEGYTLRADERLVKIAYELLKSSPDYLADARQYAAVDNTIVGSVMAITGQSPRWATEDAVKEAVRRITEEEQ